MTSFNQVYKAAMNKTAMSLRERQYVYGGGQAKDLGTGALLGAGLGTLVGGGAGGYVGSQLTKDMSPARRLATILLLGSVGAGTGTLAGTALGAGAGGGVAAGKRLSM